MMIAQKWVNTKWLEIAAIALLLIISSFLFLLNLGNHYLWQDEAQTALIAQTVLDHGIPLGHDGRNSLSQEEGAEFGSDRIYKWHPWLTFYILAGFFKLFGVSTLTARLPFALFGIGTILMTYLLAKQIVNTRTAFLTAFLLMLCVPFILLSKQCRYYSPSIFFAVLTLTLFLSVVKRGKWETMSALVLCLGVDFHIQSVNYLILASTMALYSLFIDRKTFRRSFLVLILSTLFVVPWLLYTSDISYRAVYPEMMTLIGMTDSLPQYVLLLLKHIVPYAFLLFLLILFMVQVIRKKRVPEAQSVYRNGVILLLLYILLGILLLSFFNVAVFFRYLGPLIPVILLFVALGIDYAIRVNIVLGVIAALISFSIYPIQEYLYEITHDYDGPIEGIVTYLNSHGSSKDTVAVTYEDMPIKFYTGMRVVGGLTGESLPESRAARWIILRKHDITSRVKDVREYFLTFLNEQEYEPVELAYPDIPFENREDPSWHQYRTADVPAKVVIYQRQSY
ncbi:MAG: glycosyltransferase family 39 protein [bacterium]